MDLSWRRQDKSAETVFPAVYAGSISRGMEYKMSFKKRVLAASLAAVMALGMTTGCTSVRKSDLSKDYSEVVAASYGNDNVYLDEVNYILRERQRMYEYYGAIYGMNIWDSEGMEDALREETMTSIYQTRVLCDHAADYKIELTDEEKKLVEESLDKTFEKGNADFLEIAGSDKEMLTKLLTMNALANKVYHAIIEETEITTKEEDVRHVGVSYILMKEEPEEDETESAEDSDEEEAAEEETKEAEKYYTEEEANKVLEAIQGGATLEQVADGMDMEVSTNTYGVNEAQTTAVGNKALTMKKGESAIAYDKESGWYIIVCDTENDEDATKEAYEDAVDAEKEAHFEEVYGKLSKEKFKVNEDVIASLDIAGTSVVNFSGSDEEETLDLEEETSEETESETKAE